MSRKLKTVIILFTYIIEEFVICQNFNLNFFFTNPYPQLYPHAHPYTQTSSSSYLCICPFLEENIPNKGGDGQTNKQTRQNCRIYFVNYPNSLARLICAPGPYRLGEAIIQVDKMSPGANIFL